MRKLVSFFVKRYKTLLELRVRAYLDSKKLMLDQWLDAVENNRRGDILCVYFLSLVTGRAYSCTPEGRHQLVYT